MSFFKSSESPFKLLSNAAKKLERKLDDALGIDEAMLKNADGKKGTPSGQSEIAEQSVVAVQDSRNGSPAAEPKSKPSTAKRSILQGAASPSAKPPLEDDLMKMLGEGDSKPRKGRASGMSSFFSGESSTSSLKVPDSVELSSDAEAILVQVLEHQRKKKIRVVDMFQEFDKNRDGVVSRLEFTKALERICGDKFSSEGVQDLLKVLDSNGDGVVEYKELNALLKKVSYTVVNEKHAPPAPKVVAAEADVSNKANKVEVLTEHLTSLQQKLRVSLEHERQKHLVDIESIRAAGEAMEKSLRGKMDNLQREASEAQESLSASRHQMDSLLAENEKFKEKIEALQSETKQKSEREAQLESTIDNLKIELNTARETAAELQSDLSEKSEASRKSSELENVCSELKAAREALLSENGKFKQEIESLRSECSLKSERGQQLESTIDELNVELNAARGRVEEMENVTAETSELSKVTSDLQKECAELKVAKESLVSENEKFKHEVEALESERNESQEREKKLEAEMKDLQAELSAAKENVVSMQEEVSEKLEIGKKCVELQDECSQLNATVKTLENEIRSLNSELSGGAAELSNANLKVTALESKLTEAQEQVAAISAQQNDYEQVKARSLSLEAENGMLKEQIDELKSQLASANEGANDKDLTTELNDRLQEVREELVKSKEMHEELRTQLAAASRDHEAAVKALTGDVENERSRLQAVQAELVKSNEAQEELRTELASANRDHEAAVKALTSDVENERTRLEEKASQLSLLTEEVSDLKERLQASTLETKRLLTEREDCDRQSGERVSNLDAEMSRLTIELDRVQSLCESGKSRQEELKKKLEESELARTSLEQQLAEAQGAVERATAAHSEMERVVEETRADSSVMQELQSELAASKAENERLLSVLQEKEASFAMRMEEFESDRKKESDTQLGRIAELEASMQQASEEREVMVQQLNSKVSELEGARDSHAEKWKKEVETAQQQIKRSSSELAAVSTKLETAEEQASAHKRSLEDLTKEFTTRLATEEKKAQALKKERDELKKEMEKMSGRSTGEMDVLKKENMEKDSIAAELRSEGEKLAKRIGELEASLKKIRKEKKQADTDLEKLRSDFETAESTVEALKAANKEFTVEIRDNKEALQQMKKVSDAASAELSSRSEELEESQQLIEELRAELEDAQKRAEGMKKSHYDQQEQVEQLLDETRERLRQEYELKMKHEQESFRLKEEGYVQSIEDLRQTLTRQTQRHEWNEDVLRRELKEVEERLRTAENRNEQLSTSVPEATKPLLRQIESLQAASRASADAWQQVESNLMNRAKQAESAALVASEQERAVIEKLHDTVLQLKSVEAQLVTVRGRNKELEEIARSNESSKHENDVQVSALSEHIQRVEEELKQSKQHYAEKEGQFKSKITTLTDQLKLVTEQHQVEKSSLLDQVRSLEQREVHGSSGAGTPATTPMSPSGGRKVSSDGSDLVGAVHRLERKLREKGGEIDLYRDQISNLETVRETLTEEIISLQEKNRETSEQLLQYPRMEGQLAELSQRHDAVLELLGEKSEECDELQQDIRDMKSIFKEQVNLLTLQLEQLTQQE